MTSIPKTSLGGGLYGASPDLIAGFGGAFRHGEGKGKEKNGKGGVGQGLAPKWGAWIRLYLSAFEAHGLIILSLLVVCAAHFRNT